MTGKALPSGDATAAHDVEIDIYALLRYAIGAWRFVLVCVIVAFCITAWSLRSASPIYEANMAVAGADNSDASAGGSRSISSLVLTSITGGSSGVDGLFDEFRYKMTSPSVVHAANTDGKLYEWIYPGLWDARTRSWKNPSGIVQFFLGLERGFFNKPAWLPPDDVMTSEILSKQVVFETIPRSTLTSVKYQNTDPRIATEMLRRLFAEADRQIRDQQRQRLKAQIANANDMLAATQVSDLRMAMAQQLAQTQYRLMNVPDNVDYSAQQVEVPFVSSLPVSPKIGLSLALAAITTFLLATFAAVAYRLIEAELRWRGKASPLSALREAFPEIFRKPTASR